MVRTLLAAWLVPVLGASLIPEVRSAIARNDYAGAESRVAAYRAARGVTPEMLEALSWLGRGALADKSYDRADAYAAETRRLSVELLKKQPLDSEPHLPIALGAAIEVQARVMAARGERDRAITFLRQQRETYRDTSILTRIQKNLLLLSLEGKPAPPLEMRQWIGAQPPKPLERLRGRPVLLFFWAHWCGDCKNQAPILARIRETFGAQGLLIIGPTQHYGYASGGQDASTAAETAYIDQVRRQYYAPLADMPVPLSNENFRAYGCSTTPTLVLLDSRGIVRLYHPGAMSYQELEAAIAGITARGSS